MLINFLLLFFGLRNKQLQAETQQSFSFCAFASLILPAFINTLLKEQIGLFASRFAVAHYKVNMSASTLGKLASEAPPPLAFTTSHKNHWSGARREERGERGGRQEERNVSVREKSGRERSERVENSLS